MTYSFDNDQDWSVNLPSGYHQGRLLLDPFNKLYCNMNVVPQYKVIVPYIIMTGLYIIKKIMLRDKI